MNNKIKLALAAITLTTTGTALIVNEVIQDDANIENQANVVGYQVKATAPNPKEVIVEIIVEEIASTVTGTVTVEGTPQTVNITNVTESQTLTFTNITHGTVDVVLDLTITYPDGQSQQDTDTIQVDVSSGVNLPTISLDTPTSTLTTITSTPTWDDGGDVAADITHELYDATGTTLVESNPSPVSGTPFTFGLITPLEKETEYMIKTSITNIEGGADAQATISTSVITPPTINTVATENITHQGVDVTVNFDSGNTDVDITESKIEIIKVSNSTIIRSKFLDEISGFKYTINGLDSETDYQVKVTLKTEHATAVIDESKTFTTIAAPLNIPPSITTIKPTRVNDTTNKVNVKIDFIAYGTLTNNSYIKITDPTGINPGVEVTTGGSNWVSGTPVEMPEGLLLDTEYSIEVSLENEHGTSTVHDEVTFTLDSLKSFSIEEDSDKIKIDYNSPVVGMEFRLYKTADLSNILGTIHTSTSSSDQTHTFDYQPILGKTSYTVKASHPTLGGDTTEISIMTPGLDNPHLADSTLTVTNNPFGSTDVGSIKLDLSILQKGVKQVEAIYVSINEGTEIEIEIPDPPTDPPTDLTIEVEHTFSDLENGSYEIQIRMELDASSEYPEMISSKDINIVTDVATIPGIGEDNSEVPDPVIDEKTGSRTHTSGSITTEITTPDGNFDKTEIDETNAKYEIVDIEGNLLVDNEGNPITATATYDPLTGKFTLGGDLVVSEQIVESGYSIVLTGVIYKGANLSEPLNVKTYQPIEIDNGINGGLIAGIVFGSLAGIALLGAGGYYAYSKRDILTEKQHNKKQAATQEKLKNLPTAEEVKTQTITTSPSSKKPPTPKAPPKTPTPKK